MAFSAISTTGWTVPQTPVCAAPVASPADTPATRSDFAACIDCCVRALIVASPTRAPDTALRRLRGWLDDDAAALADGTPIDFALFDDAILSIGERISQTGAQTQTQLLSASRRLAESIYAKT